MNKGNFANSVVVAILVFPFNSVVDLSSLISSVSDVPFGNGVLGCKLVTVIEIEGEDLRNSKSV